MYIFLLPAFAKQIIVKINGNWLIIQIFYYYSPLLANNGAGKWNILSGKCVPAIISCGRNTRPNDCTEDTELCNFKLGDFRLPQFSKLKNGKIKQPFLNKPNFALRDWKRVAAKVAEEYSWAITQAVSTCCGRLFPSALDFGLYTGSVLSPLCV